MVKDHANKEILHKDMENIRARNVQLAEELTRVERDAWRTRASNTLILQAHQLASLDLSLKQIGTEFLKVLVDTVAVNCAAFLRYSTKKKRFIPQNVYGFPKGQTPVIDAAVPPEAFHYANPASPPDPKAVPILEATKLPCVLWAYNAAAGIALLVGSTSWEQPQRLGFEPEDREIITTALQVFTDISERKHAGDALLEIQERLELAVQGADLGMWDWNVKTGKVFFSPRWITMLGYEEHEIEPNYRAWEKLLHPDDVPKVLGVLKEHLEGQTPFYRTEFRLLTKEGSWKWILARGKVVESGEDGKPVRCTGTHLDITDRKAAEEALEYRYEFERLITTVSSIFINLSSDAIDRGIRSALKIIGEFAGVDRIYVFLIHEGRTRMSNTHEWCAPGVEARMEKLQDITIDAFPWCMERLENLELIHVPRVDDLPKKAAREKSFLQSYGVQSVIFVPKIYAGILVGFLGFDSVKAAKQWDEEIITSLKLVGEILTNALERKRAEVELRESEERFRSVADSAQDAVLIMDSDGSISFWNSAAEEIFGYTFKEVLGRNLHKLLGPDSYYEKYKKAFPEFKRSGEGPVIGKTMELPAVRKNGEVIPVELSVSSLRLKGQWHAVGICRDITDRKQAEAKLTETLAQLKNSHSDLLSILNELTMGTALFDEDGRITFLSHTGEVLTGLEEEAVLHRYWEEVLPFEKDQMTQLEEMIKRPVKERRRIPVFRESSRGRRYCMDVEIKDDPRDPNKRILLLYDTSELHNLRQLLGEKVKYQDIIGKSKPMQLVFEQIQQLCQLDTTVLIEGETGTGKELVARALHFASQRKNNPFIAVNCSGLTESVLHSQLFGHKRGSFTGAVEDHRGVFEDANEGTVFLDEIAGISPSVQASLLRVLDEKEIAPLGESKPKKIDVRILAASNQNLSLEVDKGTFRPDLLFRIRVARIQLPPLRDRREDIPLLAQAFLGQSLATSNKTVEDISPETFRLLMAYNWPGNVRELKNAIEFASIRCKQTLIQPYDLPPEIFDPGPLQLELDGTESDEKQILLAALRNAGGNRTVAARLLGISRATLYRRLSSLKIKLN